ncbi:hypothetical protein V8E36_002939 [Tilletia maclaganii]
MLHLTTAEIEVDSIAFHKSPPSKKTDEYITQAQERRGRELMRRCSAALPATHPPGPQASGFVTTEDVDAYRHIKRIQAAGNKHKIALLLLQTASKQLNPLHHDPFGAAGKAQVTWATCRGLRAALDGDHVIFAVDIDPTNVGSFPIAAVISYDLLEVWAEVSLKGVCGHWDFGRHVTQKRGVSAVLSPPPPPLLLTAPPFREGPESGSNRTGSGESQARDWYGPFIGRL